MESPSFCPPDSLRCLRLARPWRPLLFAARKRQVVRSCVKGQRVQPGTSAPTRIRLCTDVGVLGGRAAWDARGATRNNFERRWGLEMKTAHEAAYPQGAVVDRRSAAGPSMCHALKQVLRGQPGLAAWASQAALPTSMVGGAGEWEGTKPLSPSTSFAACGFVAPWLTFRTSAGPPFVRRSQLLRSCIFVTGFGAVRRSDFIRVTARPTSCMALRMRSYSAEARLAQFLQSLRGAVEWEGLDHSRRYTSNAACLGEPRSRFVRQSCGDRPRALRDIQLFTHTVYPHCHFTSV